MSRRTGLTLTELMVALALTGLLAAAALRIAGGLLRGTLSHQDPVPADQVQESVRDLLVMDIVHADRYLPSTKGLELMTRARLSADTLELRHLPTQVSYGTVEIGGRSWLRRTQQMPSGDRRTDLVCSGVRGIAMVLPQSNGPPAPGQWRAIDPKAAIRIDTTTGSWELPLRCYREEP